MASHPSDGRKDDSGGSSEGCPRAVPEKRVLIGTVPLDPISLPEAVVWTLNCLEIRGNRPPARISCPNASLVVLAQRDPAFREMVRTSELVVADGLPLLWAAALLGTPLAGQVRGVDLMEEVCAAGAARGMSIYIVGGLPGAAERAAERLASLHPGLRVAGLDCPPIGFERDPQLSRQVVAKIAAAAPDFLIVALGSPKQERWIAEVYRELPVGVIHGVGAAIDTVAGLRQRPPEWMRNIGLEWFGRLLLEPRRLWRRYMFGNLRFLRIVWRQWRAERRNRRPASGV
jgi:N-acetylglucosaminyldiphosphoundecaprenol N-acetyl-beta-D-mannosaminyltransferase